MHMSLQSDWTIFRLQVSCNQIGSARSVRDANMLDMEIEDYR